MTALKYSEIPVYLHDSSFYQSLNSEDESSVIDVPELFYMASDSVEDVADLKHMLHVAKYWGLNSLTLGPVKFCFENLALAWPVVSAFENAHPDFATLFQGGVDRTLIEAIKTNKRGEIVDYLAKMNSCLFRDNAAMVAAAEAGRLDFIEMMHKLGFVWESDANVTAARAGHLDCLEYLCENATVDVCSGRCAEVAAENGHVECLRYLHNTYDLPTRNFYPETMASTALGGHMECLKVMCELNYTDDSSVTANAAMGGHLDCLKFLRSIGCEWDNVTMVNAAEKGHLSCLKYAIENGCPREPAAMDLAVKNGHKECVRYLLSEGFQPKPSNITDAARRGDIETIKLLREVGCPWPEESVLDAAVSNDRNHWACLEFLFESGCTVGGQSGTLLKAAVGAGRSDMLAYLLRMGCVLDDNVVTNCVRSGHVSCLQFVLEAADLVLSWKHCSQAIEFGQIDCLKFLRARGVPWDKQTIVMARPDNEYAGKLDCFLYAVAHGCPLPLPQHEGGGDLCAALMKYRGFTVEHLKRLRDAKCPWTAETMRIAALKGMLDCVEYTILNGCSFPVWKKRKLEYIRVMKDSNGTVNCIKCLHLAQCPWDGLLAESKLTPEQREYLVENECPEHDALDLWSKVMAQPIPTPKPFTPAVLFENSPATKQLSHCNKRHRSAPATVTTPSSHAVEGTDNTSN